MSKQKMEYRVGVGASSILMILVVLALTALALLSFSGAKSADVLAKRNQAMVVAYYQAMAKAREKLAALDHVIVEMQKDASQVSASQQLQVGEQTDASLLLSFTQRVAQAGLTDIQIEEGPESSLFSFQVDASYGRLIMVEGQLADEPGMPRYYVTRQELVSLPTEDEGDQYKLLQ